MGNTNFEKQLLAAIGGRCAMPPNYDKNRMNVHTFKIFIEGDCSYDNTYNEIYVVWNHTDRKDDKYKTGVALYTNLEWITLTSKED